MSEKKMIVIASDNSQVRQMARAASLAESLEPILCGDGLEALESLKRESSQGNNVRLVILESYSPKLDGFEVASKMAETPELSHIPILMLIGQESSAASAPLHPSVRSGSLSIENLSTRVRLGADNYLKKPFDQPELTSIVHSMNKHYRSHNAPHSLTGLLGHVAAEKEIFDRLARGEVFNLLWVDINHFRAFNDHYETNKGDAAILELRDVLKSALSSVREAEGLPEPFLGHIDGDDFIVIASASVTEKVAETARHSFEKSLTKFYSEKELSEGMILEKSREDQKERVFPLLSATYASVGVSLEEFTHYGHLVSKAQDQLRQAKLVS